MLNGRIILEWMLEKWGGGGVADFIHLASDRDQWWGVVNTVMDLWVCKRQGISWLAE
jgi:hypothetical protein